MPTKPQPNRSWENSRFYRRLRNLAAKHPDARELLSKVDHVAHQSAEIAKYIVAFLPQYTDHGERHLVNVLGFMDDLAGKKNVDMLSDLECALAILAALVHDLGMVPDEQEQEVLDGATVAVATPEARAWETFRDGQALWHHYQRLNDLEKASARGRQMLGQVRADYLRDTHSREAGQSGYNRLLRWLERLAKGKGNDFYSHNGFNFREGLAFLSLSHGQDISWMPARLAATDSPYADVKQDSSKAYACGPDQVNWPWLSWLLRLADIMDCDASRTPAVLFDSIGLHDAKSQGEWKKHLAIPKRPEFHRGNDKQTLSYQCPECPDPFTEKALHDIEAWINLEIDNVRRELGANRKHFPDEKSLSLDLPSHAEVNISARRGNYVYLDLHFRLDREAVMELLMGEVLYGEPDLALRELVQNSLDALHLRDLRHKLLLSLHEREPAEELIEPVVPPLANEPLQVSVRWDTPANGAPWIEVEDNGVGMNREVIERFLTQIGKSYYKSPDFLRERELMKRNGLLCTTMSQFGIGFLACFMLAETIDLDTRAAVKGNTPENGWRVIIHQPHDLITLYPLETKQMKSTGTRVRLTLKAGLSLEKFDVEVFRKRLRDYFYGEEYRRNHPLEGREEGEIEPAWSLGRGIVWPLYPVRIHPPGSPNPITLDDSFHMRELIPFPCNALGDKATEWTFPRESLGQPHWAIWDWVDSGTEDTGSRIRVMFANHDGQLQGGRDWRQVNNTVQGLMRRSELLALTESCLPVDGRTLILINGVLVPDWKKVLFGWLTIANGVGGVLWLDLRGSASPRLRADRHAPTSRQMVEPAVRIIQKRFCDSLADRTLASDVWIRLVLWGLPVLSGQEKCSAWALGANLPCLSQRQIGPGFLAMMLAQENAIAYVFKQNIQYFGFKDFALECVVPRNVDLALALNNTNINTDCSKAPSFGFVHGLNKDALLKLDFAFDLAQGYALNIMFHMGQRHMYERGLIHDLRGTLYRDQISTGLPSMASGLLWWHQAYWLSEALQPSLERSFPPLSCPGAEGPLGKLMIFGPMLLTQPSVSKVLPNWLVDFDLIAPFTDIPLGPLARKCPSWATELSFRLMFILPFIFGQMAERWRKKAELITKVLGVDGLLLYIPSVEHLDKSFIPIPGDWFGDGMPPSVLSEADWRNSGTTALWDIKNGRVLWSAGIRTREELSEFGQPLHEWIVNTNNKA